jgi:hypothetical protein
VVLAMAEACATGPRAGSSYQQPPLAEPVLQIEGVEEDHGHIYLRARVIREPCDPQAPARLCGDPVQGVGLALGSRERQSGGDNRTGYDGRARILLRDAERPEGTVLWVNGVPQQGRPDVARALAQAASMAEAQRLEAEEEARLALEAERRRQEALEAAREREEEQRRQVAAERRARCEPEAGAVRELVRGLAHALSRVDYTRASGLGAMLALTAAGYRNGRSYLEAVAQLESGERENALSFLALVRRNAGDEDPGIAFLREALRMLGIRATVDEAILLVVCGE